MQFGRTQLSVLVAVAYLIAATGIAVYATSRGANLALPIPLSLSTSATLTPVISFALYAASHVYSRHPKRTQSTRFLASLTVNFLILVPSIVMMTLLGTYISHAGRQCLLRDQWSSLFHNKDAKAISYVQDAFACCGLKNSRDMVWPFPDKEHGPDACEVAYGRRPGCLEGWSGEEQRISGLLLFVVSTVVLCQIVVNIAPEMTWFGFGSRRQAGTPFQGGPAAYSDLAEGQRRLLHDGQVEEYSDHPDHEAGEAEVSVERRRRL